MPLGHNIGHTLDPTNSHVTGDAKVCGFWVRQVGMVSGGFVMQVVPSFSIPKTIKLSQTVKCLLIAKIHQICVFPSY